MQESLLGSAPQTTECRAKIQLGIHEQGEFKRPVNSQHILFRER
jgi:hypothetical protein